MADGLLDGVRVLDLGIWRPVPGGGAPVARAPVADIASGAYAAMAICAALVRAGRTGEGEVIDVSMTDVLATWTGPAGALDGGDHVGGQMPGYGPFRAADGW